jgi:hypothetical protein
VSQRASSLGDIVDRFLADEIEASVPSETVSDEEPLWTPLPGPQTEALNSPADELFFGGGGGGGKDLWVGTPVPVPTSVHPSGFIAHGELRPGDFVYGVNGEPTMVVTRFAITTQEAFEVEFSTGEVVVANGDHLWHTWSASDRKRLRRRSDAFRSARRANRPSRAKPESKKPWVSRTVTRLNQERAYDYEPVVGGVRTTREIALTLGARKSSWNHAIDVAAPIVGPDCDLPIEPYLFGLWLGDGTSRAPSIGMAEDDWTAVSSHVPVPDSERVDIRPPRATPFVTRRFSAMLPALRRLGVLGAKRIPPLYLRASAAQRLALLQGLLDTDGHCDHRGQVELGLSDEALARDAWELVSSLGAKSSLRRKPTKHPARDSWRMKFVPSFVAFRLPRKALRQRQALRSPRCGRRYIVAVRPTAPVPMCCIKVAAADGLYLVGRSFIPTHNSDLLLGAAMTRHRSSIIFRTEFTQFRGALGLWERSHEIVGERGTPNESQFTWRDLPGNRTLEFGAARTDRDRLKYRGRPHDLKGFDELPEMAEQVYRFLIGWLRTTVIGQRVRVIATGNPPTTTEGQWVIRYWAPWLDPAHPHPAAPGELRWFAVLGGKDVEVPGPQAGWERAPVVHEGGRAIHPRSRTFIRALVDDNPYYMRTGYAQILEALPEPLRSQMRYGSFTAASPDDPWQVIPTEWVLAAQARWTPECPGPLTVVGVDPSRGGSDQFVIAHRHGHWIGPLEKHAAKEAMDGLEGAALVFKSLAGRADIPTQIDILGTAGSSVYDQAKVLGLHAVPMNSTEKAVDGNGKPVLDKAGKLGFVNKRSEWHWRMREALDPSSGQEMALPPDPQLRADLCAARWKPTPRGIQIEHKDEIKKRIGRSPDCGEAVIYACASEYLMGKKKLKLVAW